MQFFVGTYSVEGSPGIAICNLEKTELSQTGAYQALVDPTWLLRSNLQPVLYAIGSRADGTQVVSSFSIENNSLRLLSQQATHGNGSCHLSVDKEERWLIQQEGSNPVIERQDGPHAHQSVWRPGTDEIFVCDLGADQIFIYRMTELLQSAGSIQTPRGSGPRHLAFDGPGRLYVVAELSNQVLYYALKDKAWMLQQVLTTLPHPAPENTAAAIRLFEGTLYVSNRGHESIAGFSINPDGSLQAHGWVSVHGKGPRDFVRIPEGFLVANQYEGGLVHLDIHGAVLGSLPIPGAVCIAGI